VTNEKKIINSNEFEINIIVILECNENKVMSLKKFKYKVK